MTSDVNDFADETVPDLSFARGLDQFRDNVVPPVAESDSGVDSDTEPRLYRPASAASHLARAKHFTTDARAHSDTGVAAIPVQYKTVVSSSMSSTSSPISPASSYLSLVNRKASPHNPIQVGAYKLGRVLGSGGFSIVREAIAKDSVFAVKIVDCRHVNVDELEHEIELWQGLHHPHILPLLDVERTKNLAYLFTLHCPSPSSLFEVVRRRSYRIVTESDVLQHLKYLAHLASAVAYLHSNLIVHRDIKLENCLLHPTRGLLLSDFGLSVRVGEVSQRANTPAAMGIAPTATRLRRCVSDEDIEFGLCIAPGGSLPYAAPELLDDDPPQPRFSQDLWALGVLTYTLATGHLPWANAIEWRLREQIRKGEWSLDGPFGKICERTLVLDNSRRTPAAELVPLIETFVEEARNGLCAP